MSPLAAHRYQIAVLVEALGRLLEGAAEIELELTEPELLVYGSQSPGDWRISISLSRDLVQIESRASTWAGVVAELMAQL